MKNPKKVKNSPTAPLIYEEEEVLRRIEKAFPTLTKKLIREMMDCWWAVEKNINNIPRKDRSFPRIVGLGFPKVEPDILDRIDHINVNYMKEVGIICESEAN